MTDEAGRRAARSAGEDSTEADGRTPVRMSDLLIWRGGVCSGERRAGGRQLARGEGDVDGLINPRMTDGSLIPID
jgi:hypothetical protein